MFFYIAVLQHPGEILFGVFYFGIATYRRALPCLRQAT
jgi:hypothetical protein